MKEKKSYYAIIPANVRYDPNLNANAKLMYGEITALANEKGYCWASNNYFARLYEVSTKTISRWINQLKKYGYIDVKMVYAKNSKEIEHRYVQICPGGMDKNVHRGMDKNVQENITSINNTINKVDHSKTFVLFWKEYPKRINKVKALAIWEKKIKPDKELYFEIIRGLRKWKQTRQWQDKKYIPHPTTWLNGKQWEDEVEIISNEVIKIK